MNNIFLNPSNKYALIVKQQPIRARVCSSREKADRRPLDPPPVVQLYQTNNMNFNDYQNSANFFLHATLIDPAHNSDLNYIYGTPVLAGSVVQSLHKLKDANNTEGAFFIFSNINIRTEGIFKLKFTLFQIKGLEVERVCSVLSEPFKVYSPKAFPGMSESTELTRSFSDQGIRIRIRKESRKRKRRTMDSVQSTDEEQSYTNEEEDDDDRSKSNIMSMKNLLIPLPPISDKNLSPRSSPLQTIEPSISSFDSHNYYYTASNDNSPTTSTSSNSLLHPPLNHTRLFMNKPNFI